MAGSSDEPVLELSCIYDHFFRPRLDRDRSAGRPAKTDRGSQIARECVCHQGRRQKAQEPPHPSLHPVFV